MSGSAGYLNLRPEQSNIFFKLMEERYRRRASVITTNLDYDDWFNFLGNKPMVTALLSRRATNARPSGSTACRFANPRADRRGRRCRGPSHTARAHGHHPDPGSARSAAHAWPISRESRSMTSFRA